MTNSKCTRIAAISAAATLAVAASGAALAVPTTNGALTEQRIIVDYADLDIDRQAGAETLYKRITAAAERVCGTQDPRASLAARRVVRACFVGAVDDAVRSIDHPDLNRIHRS